MLAPRQPIGPGIVDLASRYAKLPQLLGEEIIMVLTLVAYLMHETSLSLLDRVKDLADSQSWGRLVDIYSPLLHCWLRRYDIQDSDANDLVQEVLSVVVRELPNFRHNERVGAFRNWLRTVLAYRVKHYWRSNKHRPQPWHGSELAAKIDALENYTSGISRIWNEEHDQFVIQRMLDAVQPRFKTSTWDAFRGQVIEGRAAEAVAAELGLPIASVYAAKSRVLNALRQESSGLVDVL